MKSIITALCLFASLAFGQNYIAIKVEIPENHLCVSTNLSGPWSTNIWRTNYSKNVVGFFQVGTTNLPPTSFLTGSNVTISVDRIVVTNQTNL